VQILFKNTSKLDAKDKQRTSIICSWRYWSKIRKNFKGYNIANKRETRDEIKDFKRPCTSW
jgi:hypothetical protein